MALQMELLPRRRMAVEPIADHRAAGMRTVHADLVRAAGLGLQFEPGRVRAAAKHLVACDRFLPLVRHLHGPAASAVKLEQRPFEYAFISRRAAFDDGPIGLLGSTAGEEP